MIATRSPRSAFTARAGCVQPLSAILPAVLRQYGVQWPPESSSPDVCRSHLVGCACQG